MILVQILVLIAIAFASLLNTIFKPEMPDMAHLIGPMCLFTFGLLLGGKTIKKQRCKTSNLTVPSASERKLARQLNYALDQMRTVIINLEHRRDPGAVVSWLEHKIRELDNGFDPAPEVDKPEPDEPEGP
ncbi:hypothetical protein HN358_02460 [Candidatus Uhrbacteria bacterium]|jgi:hypothetical protein|nr:hypothetical protein [Candidatus Uhrbacteria bacterium]MBT7717542.1 hypothetical protein [Candidatus Uhrbacteria bacterium]